MGKPPRRSPKEKESESYQRRRPLKLFQNRDSNADVQPSKNQSQRVEFLLKLGIDAIQSRRIDDAIGYLTNLLALAPHHALAHNCLGIARRASGDVARAIACYEQALLCDPHYAEAHNNLGVACESQQDIARAVTAYEAALASKPNFAAALNNLGAVLTKMGKVDAAVVHLRKAIREQPGMAAAHNNLGLALCRLEEIEEAADCFRRALSHQPKFCEAYVNLGNLLRSEKKLAAAAECYRTVLEVQPHYAAALTGLGNVFLDQDKTSDALSIYDQALKLIPQLAEAHFGKGSVAMKLERWNDAERYFRRAIESCPTYAEAFNNLGITYRLRGNTVDAETAFQSAVRANPDLIAAYNNLGNLYRTQDRQDRAAEAYGQVMQRRRNMPLAKLRLSTLCPATFGSRAEMDDHLQRVHEEWTSLRGAYAYQDLVDLLTVANEPPYNMQFFAENIRPLKEAYSAIFRYTGPSFHEHTPSSKIRIGCVVTKQHEVAFLRLIWDSLRRMNRDEFEVTVVCDPESAGKFRIALDDETTPIVPFPTRPHQILHAIREQRFDILYYFEICTDATNYFLPYFRLAPMQVTSWGIQVTSGIPNVDAYLSSQLVEAPGADDHYSERLVRASTLLTFQKRVERPTSPKTREAFGFSKQQHLYVCAQHVGKFHPDFDVLMAEILRRDPNGVVVGTEDQHGFGARVLRQRWERDIPDVASRIVFLPRLPRIEYHSLLMAGEVMLDPLHFGGVSSTYDSLSLERPLVTMPSQFHRGRYTAGCFRRMGLASPVANSAEEYIQMALSMGCDDDYRARAIAEIRENAWRVFEDVESVAEHERIFRELAQRKACP